MNKMVLLALLLPLTSFAIEEDFPLGATNAVAEHSSITCTSKEHQRKLLEQETLEILNTDVTMSVDQIITDKVCEHFSSYLSSGVPIKPLKQALNYFIKNRKKFKKKRYITISDYSVSSSKKRFYLLDTITGKVKSYHVSHGSGKSLGYAYGDPDHDGNIDSCILKPKQLKAINKTRLARGKKPIHKRWAMTRAGFYSTLYLANSRAHDPNNPKARQPWPMFSTKPRRNKMLLDGLVKGVNDDALRNGVVMHEAFYNKGKIMGRSFGCPAFRPKEGREIMNIISGGSLYYSYVPKCNKDMEKVENEVIGWENTCSN